MLTKSFQHRRGERAGDLADAFADLLGIYGGHDKRCTFKRPCRCCFMSELAVRMREAVQNEQVREPLRATSPKGHPPVQLGLFESCPEDEGI